MIPEPDFMVPPQEYLICPIDTAVYVRSLRYLLFKSDVNAIIA